MNQPRNDEWEAMCAKLGLSQRTQHLLTVPRNEAGATAIVRLMLVTGVLASAWDLPEVAGWEQEFGFPRGRADFVLFHVDGSVTIVELKNTGTDREILGGIGQLSMYAIQAGYGMRGALIRRILAAAVPGRGNEHLEEACRLAGVTFEALGPITLHQENISQVVKTWRETSSVTE